MYYILRMPYKDKAKIAEYHKIWYEKYKEESLRKHREYYLKLRIRVLEHYSGGMPRCECCGETTVEFLSLDHINGGGTKHRKKIGYGRIYYWIIQNGFPEGFRVLCHNCNQAIGVYGKCPHGVLK